MGRQPLEAEVLQVKGGVGEFAAAAAGASPLVLLGRYKPLHVRVDVDEHEGWRVHPGPTAGGRMRGNTELKAPLSFVRVEPFVIPNPSPTGESPPPVATRGLQIFYQASPGHLSPVLRAQSRSLICTRRGG